MMRHLSCLVALLLGVIAVGCGSGGSSATAPVSGTVTFLDKPLKGGTIIFHPKGKGNPGYGEIGSDGKFTITTYAANDGAVLGMHTVTVEPAPSQSQPVLPGTEDQFPTIPKRYSDPKESPLRFEVKPGTNTPNFPLKKE